MRKLKNSELGRLSAQEYADFEKLPIVVLVDNVRSLNNVGSFFRTGDAFAIERLVLCGITATPPSKEIHKTALGAESTVSWSYSESAESAAQELKDQGYELLAVEQVNGAIMLNYFTIDRSKKYALVFGNEVSGVSQEVVDLCHSAIEIPQAGTKHSLNVSVSAGVVLWKFFEQFK